MMAVVTQTQRGAEVKRFILAQRIMGVPQAWMVPWSERGFDPRKTVGQIYTYTDKQADLYEDDIPTDLLELAGEHIQWLVAPELRSDILIVHIPPARMDKADMLGQRGYLGWVFKGDGALEQYTDERGIVRMVNRG